MIKQILHRSNSFELIKSKVIFREYFEYIINKLWKEPIYCIDNLNIFKKIEWFILMIYDDYGSSVLVQGKVTWKQDIFTLYKFNPKYMLIYFQNLIWEMKGEENMRNDVLNLINPMEESELEQILGGGDGVFKTISHECNMNTWQFIFTCC